MHKIFISIKNTTMRGYHDYKELADTMRLMKKQICDSLHYCRRFQGHATPESLFNDLKLRITYVEDPPNIELMHSAQSLFTDNYHGLTGAGDCDDFTILAAAALWCNNFHTQEIVLAGRTKEQAVHVYNQVKFAGQWYAFDLTNSSFGTARKYKFKQYLVLSLHDC